MNKKKYEANIAKLAAAFPECVCEMTDKDGNTVRTVDFEALRSLFEGGDGSCTLTWRGKKEAVEAAQIPAQKSLILCPEESCEPDTTNNLYIEGDNLDALKLLQNDYSGKVKVIYIDPPYNTGNDYIYSDSFSHEGKINKTKPAGRRSHSAWCSMMYPRLKAAKELLSDDGVIFISINDIEQANLKLIAGEIFGEGNFLAQIIWERAFSPVNLKKHFSESHDFILCYAKNKPLAKCNGLPRSKKANGRYSNPDNDPRGPWTSGDLSVGPRIDSKVYEITAPGGRKILPPSGYCWRLDKETFESYLADNRIWFGEDGNNVPRIKRFLSEVKSGITPMTIWKHTEVGHSQEATQKLKKLFDGQAFFNYPKPVELIKRCIRLYSDKDSIILDFFSGSATTAQAVMELNAEDGGSRRFITVQLPEKTAEKSEAYLAGYKNICEIGRERIKRAGAKIKAKTCSDADCGFKTYKLTDT